MKTSIGLAFSGMILLIEPLDKGIFFGYTLENVFQTPSNEMSFWGSLMAAASLASIPTIVFFLFVQKYMVQGVVAGAVKG